MLMLHGVCAASQAHAITRCVFDATFLSMKPKQKPSQEIWRCQDFHQINTTRTYHKHHFSTVPHHGWGPILHGPSKWAHLGPVDFPLSKVAWKHPRRSDRSPRGIQTVNVLESQLRYDIYKDTFFKYIIYRYMCRITYIYIIYMMPLQQLAWFGLMNI